MYFSIMIKTIVVQFQNYRKSPMNLQLLIFLVFLPILSNNYSPSLALELGYMSAASYESQSSIKSWSCSYCKKYSLEKINTFSSSDNSVFGFTGFNRDRNAIILAFRGSANIKNWIANLQFVFTSYPDCNGCSIHQGFYSAYKSVSTTVKSQISSLKALYRNANLYITGHSLGAALAGISSIDIHKTIGTVNDVYCFGMPRVGNPQLASYFQSKIPNTNRIINYADVVVHLPQTTFGYNHYGHQIWYHPKGMQAYSSCVSEDPKCANSVSPTQWSTDDHSLDNYLKMKAAGYNAGWLWDIYNTFKRNKMSQEEFEKAEYEGVNRIIEKIREEQKAKVVSQ